MIAGTWGGACPDDPNALARLVEEFINGQSKEAVNLRTKLQRSTDRHRHGFLVLTAAIDQAWLLDRWGIERLPTFTIKLPPEVDCLWVTRGGSTVWRFERPTGWSGLRWLPAFPELGPLPPEEADVALHVDPLDFVDDHRPTELPRLDLGGHRAG